MNFIATSNPKKILIPVTELVEVDAPTEELKARMLQSLKIAEQGEGKSYTQEEFYHYLQSKDKELRAKKKAKAA